MLLDYIKYPFSRKVRNKVKNKNFVLIMTLVVRNEDDIIEQNIRFHKAMGVDGFIVLSHNSTDETNTILHKLKDEGLVLEIVFKDGVAHEHSKWVSELIKIAKSKYNAKWVINADADEFYYSNSLNLKTSIKMCEKANIIWVDSIFLFPEHSGHFFDATYFVTRPLQRFEAQMNNILNDSIFSEFIESQGCTKVIHKTFGFRKIEDGNHDVKLFCQNKVQSADIRLYHYHIRNYEGLKRKIKRWSSSIYVLPKDQGMHMRILVDAYKEDRLIELFYEKYTLNKNALIEMGVISHDPSVKNFLMFNNIKY